MPKIKPKVQIKKQKSKKVQRPILSRTEQLKFEKITKDMNDRYDLAKENLKKLMNNEDI